MAAEAVKTLNQSNNNSYCLEFSASDLQKNTIATCILHTVAVVASIVAVIFIVISKQYRVFTNRLILYLLVISMLWSIAIMFEIMPVDDVKGTVDVKNGWKGMCETIGFISQLTETSKLLVVSWIVLYLLLLVVFNYNAKRPLHEMFGLLVVIIVPFALDWLPFKWQKYGLSGLFCWIKFTEQDCNEGYKLSLGLMFAVQYGPVLLASIFALVSFTIMVIVLCRRSSLYPELSLATNYNQKEFKELCALFTYPVICTLIFIFRLLHRIVYTVQITKHDRPRYQLWLAHSIAVGLGAILIPLAFMIHPNNLRKLSWCCCHRQTTESSDETKPFLYRSTSNTTDARDSTFLSSTLYKSILTDSSIQNRR